MTDAISAAEYRTLTKAAKRGRFAVVPKEERTIDGTTFASKREASRYAALKQRQAIGDISNLELQPRYEIKIKDIRVCVYTADFKYSDRSGHTIIEDVKGRGKGGTSGDGYYRLRKRLAEAQFGITVTEVVI